MGGFWTAARTAQLVALHASGLSAALVAAEMPGSTKNSIVGKLSRMNPRTSAAPPRPRAPRISVRQARQTRQTRAAEVIVPLSLMQLKKHSCRWPLWNDDTPPPGRFFCSARAAGVAAGRPYCAAHTKKAASHAPPSPRPRPYVLGRP